MKNWGHRQLSRVFIKERNPDDRLYTNPLAHAVAGANGKYD